MEKIENKKGNRGYRVSPWNFIGKTFTDEDKDVLEVCITHVEVYSCGKKQMVLTMVNEEKINVNRHFFKPEEPIYKTKKDAEERARQYIEEVFEASIPRIEDLIGKGEKNSKKNIAGGLKQRWIWKTF